MKYTMINIMNYNLPLNYCIYIRNFSTYSTAGELQHEARQHLNTYLGSTFVIQIK